MAGGIVDAEPRGMYGSENVIKPIERHTLACPPVSTHLSRKGRRFHGSACDIGSLFLNSHSSSEISPKVLAKEDASKGNLPNNWEYIADSER